MNRSAGCCALAMGVAVSCLGASASGAVGRDRYIYTVINPAGPSGNSFVPAINNAGTMAYLSRQSASLTQMVRMNADWSYSVMSGTETVVSRGNIAPNGAVTYLADKSGVRGVYKSSAAGSPTLIASTAGAIGTFPPSPAPMINSSGQVLFQAIGDDGISQLFQSGPSGLRLVADSTGPVKDFQGAMSQNEQGHIAYSVRMDSAQFRMFYEDQGITTDTGLVGMTSMAMNDSDLIVATAGGAVMTWDPTHGSSTLFGASGGLSLYTGLSVNNHGDVVLRANDTVTGKKGIYTGPDRINDVVAAVGDDLIVQKPDGTIGFFQISDLTLSTSAINDSGQLVFAANGAGDIWDGTALILATPVPAPAAVTGVLALGVACTGFRRRR